MYRTPTKTPSMSSNSLWSPKSALSWSKQFKQFTTISPYRSPIPLGRWCFARATRRITQSASKSSWIRSNGKVRLWALYLIIEHDYLKSNALGFEIQSSKWQCPIVRDHRMFQDHTSSRRRTPPIPCSEDRKLSRRLVLKRKLYWWSSKLRLFVGHETVIVTNSCTCLPKLPNPLRYTVVTWSYIRPSYWETSILSAHGLGHVANEKSKKILSRSVEKIDNMTGFVGCLRPTWKVGKRSWAPEKAAQRLRVIISGTG